MNEVGLFNIDTSAKVIIVDHLELWQAMRAAAEVIRTSVGAILSVDTYREPFTDLWTVRIIIKTGETGGEP